MTNQQNIFNQNTRARLKIYRGTNKDIEDLPDEDGALYFAYDSGAIFLGRNTGTKVEKIQMSSTTSGGSGNSNIVYANADEEEGTLFEVEDEENEDYGKYYIYRSAFEEDLLALPGKDTLVVNSNGWLFRVLKVQGSGGYVLAELVSSGTGGGGSSGGNTRDLDLTYTGIDLIGSQYIYNKSYDIIFYPTSDVDPVCSLKITAIDNTGANLPVERSWTVNNGTPCRFNVNLLPLSNDISLTALVTSVHSEYNKRRGYSNVFPIKTLDMNVTRHSDSDFITVQQGDANLYCIPSFTGLGTATAPVKLFYSIDNGTPVIGKTLTNADNRQKITFIVPHQIHGTHIITAWLGVNMNGIDFTSETITYEVPFRDQGNNTPLIWIKEDLGTIIQYEEAVVQYMVYSTAAALGGTDIEVQFLKNGVIFNTEEVPNTNSRWLRLDLTANYEVGRNNFSIVCGSAVKNITFQVTTEGARNLSLKYPDNLEMNFDAIGRSSKEIRAARDVWNSTVQSPQFAESPYSATLTNFNWYNNGWKNDEDGNGSYLAITNGAAVSIPAGTWSINTINAPWTFEIRFRIRNAKKFATLVTEIPIYIWKDENGNECEPGNEKTLEEIAEIPGAQAIRDADGNLVMNEANTTRKEVRDNKYIAFKYLNSGKLGFAIGTQEAYFNIGGRVVNVKYREDEVINISFVIDKSKNQLSIYLNGILSGVADLSGITGFTMQNVPFTINSEYCDFDLYKFRVYRQALSMPDVIHNYIADIKNIDLYDENQLTDANDETKLSYENLLKYNYSDPNDLKNYPGHQDSPTMPYVVIDMSGQTSTGNDELPFSKTAKGIDGTRIEFTNPTADYLLATNAITPWTYYTSSPSYTADNVNINVQGTSSQIYPRRNFKTKFKKAKNWNFTAGPLAGKSIAQAYYFNQDGSYAPETAQGAEETNDEYKARQKTFGGYKKLVKNWHMDSEAHSTNKFTWKIDYMESSGSYNTGFANLLGSGVYDKHPLEDLNISGLETDSYRTSVYGFPVLAFHKTADGQYTYIGRYNYNLDKGSNEYYGFEEEVEQPNITLTRDVLDDEGQPTGETETYHPLIADIAECWELRDNQGLWCSFRYPNDARATRFETPISNDDPGYEVVKHFEARYHKYADQFEWGQNVILGKENTEDYSDEVGSDVNTINSYLLNKLTNLQVLFDWLDSTDSKSVTDEPLPEPVTYKVNGVLTDPQAIEAQGITYSQTTVNGVQVNMGTFTKDSAEYRRQKFYNEFDLHLDRHYCAVYFVMTELLLCYDSRGKNMMIATYGPTPTSQGNYIWYPIFYDIDTQLGLNNVGAKLWDYDEDCTENGTFSTAQSVLWTNFNDLFKQQIIATYRQLRGSGDDGKLSYKNIEGAYACDPAVFKTSLAMRGRRPLVAIGLDEYYKYVLPVTVPWRSQKGTMITANYLYACQGDRKLSRELLINNRLLYMDSKWLGGTFTISSGGMAGIMFRSTANHEISTSDKYIDLLNPTGYEPGDEYIMEIEDPQTHQVTRHTYEYQPYQTKKYIDSTPQYNVTPYLNFYVTTFVDENAFQNREAYNEDKYPNGIPTVVLPSVQEAYQYGRVDQQLNYFAGSEYISSLGDLSTKYVNQIKLPDTPRLLDITLGSDAPGYFNNEILKPFELYTEVDDATGLPKKGSTKSLLDRIILTNVRGLPEELAVLDLRSPDKLTEFRALGTPLIYALFAEGAPLSIVHLPNTVTKLIFVQNKNLTRILTSTPQVLETDEHNNVLYDENGNLIYKPKSEYAGLFVDGLTNYNAETMAGRGSPITEINIEGDNMGYDSYVLLNNLVAEKNGTGRDNALAIKMTDVKWTPYIQVEYGETKMNNVTYYYLTDHSTYIVYDHDNNEWANDTLNGRVFTYNENAPKDTIQTLDLLDIFYEDYRLAEEAGELNQFRNNIEAVMNTRTYPTISGELYVNNTNTAPINELTLTNKYNYCWPNLIIRAANVQEAPVVKYVEIDPNTGKEKVLDTKYSENNKIVLTDKAAPNRVHFDFLGWSINKPDTVENPVLYVVLNNQGQWITTTEGAAAEIDSTLNTMTLYAIFAPHAYEAVFNYDNGTEPLVVTTVWEAGRIGLNESNIVPYKPYLYADDEIVPGTQMLGLYRTFAFKGWALVGDEDQNIQDLSNLVPDHNYEFIAIYEDKSVYDNILDMKYLYFNSYTKTLSLNSNYTLAGKITLPTSINGVTVEAITSFDSDSNGKQITHVFWQTENRGLKIIKSGCFRGDSQLVYYEQPNTCESIESMVFQGCSRLGIHNDYVIYNILKPIKHLLGDNIFQDVGVTVSSLDIPIYMIPGHLYETISTSYPFFNSEYNGLAKIQIGTPDDPCLWLDDDFLASLHTSLGLNAVIRQSKLQGLKIYIRESDNDENKKSLLLEKLQFSNEVIAAMETGNNNASYSWLFTNENSN